MAKNKGNKKTTSKKGNSKKTTNKKKEKTIKLKYTSKSGNRGITELTTNLFGAPFQFTDSVDPRYTSISDKVGATYLQNIMLEAPVCTLIPGVPKYLVSKKKKIKKSVKSSSVYALLQGTDFGADAVKNILNITKKDSLRLYDFQPAYTEYMNYVNLLCRTGAVYLGIDEKVKGFNRYAKDMDWKLYHWEKSKNGTYGNLKATLKKVADADLLHFNNSKNGQNGNKGNFLMDFAEAANETFQTTNIVQFYIDPDIGPSETLTNQSGQSMLSNIFSQGESIAKDVAFMANSGGVDTQFIKDMGASTSDIIANAKSILTGEGDTVPGLVSRVINLGGAVAKGENVVIPDIYQSSEYSRSFSITVHLKTPYGSKLGYYYNIYVPLMHLLAFVMPRQGTANSYASPFLVKGYVEGLMTCNLGLVTSMSISKTTESRSIDGLPTEVDVTLDIVDLYGDLSMSASNTPRMFFNNSSLHEYLATICGLSLYKPNMDKKLRSVLDVATNAVTDIPTNVKSLADEKIWESITSFSGLGI